MLTVGKLINILQEYSKDTKIIFADLDEGIDKELNYIFEDDNDNICLSEIDPSCWNDKVKPKKISP